MRSASAMDKEKRWSRRCRLCGCFINIVEFESIVLKEGHTTAAKNLYNLKHFVRGYNILFRIEWCGCSMLIARASM